MKNHLKVARRCDWHPWVWAIALGALTAGCGGGGAPVPVESPVTPSLVPNNAPPIRAALPVVKETKIPVGKRVDVSALNYFPSAIGDHWVYSVVKEGVLQQNVAERSVSASSLQGFTVALRQDLVTSTLQYLNSPDGHVAPSPLGTLPSGAANIIGSILVYPIPFFPVGTEYRVVRQGDWGADLDGDGVSESFRLEWVHSYLGVEDYTLPLSQGTGEAAHLRNTIRLTLSPSSLRIDPVTVESVEDSWWMPNSGPVKFAIRTVGPTGSVSNETLEISFGTVAGEPLFKPKPDGTSAKFQLKHNDLVFDAVRNLYYASISSSSATFPDRIAVIDAVAKTVIYSGNFTPGSDPSAMAVSNDGSTLYVGLEGTGDVVKLKLPEMTEISRTTLPTDLTFGQTVAKSIAVSTLDNNVLAIPLSSATFGGSRGIVLIRNGVIQPTVMSSGDTSHVAFDPSASVLFGYNGYSTASELRRISVLPDGLAELFFVTADFEWSPRIPMYSPAFGLALGSGVYDPNTLALKGKLASGAHSCILHSVPGQIVCLDSSAPAGMAVNYIGKLVVSDGTTYATTANLRYAALTLYDEAAKRIVSGPKGQLALSFGVGVFCSKSGNSIWLFESPALH